MNINLGYSELKGSANTLSERKDMIVCKSHANNFHIITKEISWLEQIE